MFMLHCFWFSIFIKILIKFIREGEGDDMQNKTVVEEEEVNDATKKMD